MKLPPAKILNLVTGLAAPRKRTAQSRPGGLQEIAAFGTNPGKLRGYSHVPPDLPVGAPLVVVLHGCTQHAADYDAGAGWSQLADDLGFAVLFPEQQRSNNFNLCFNWFSPIDSRRDSGEALSIRQMIDWMAGSHDIDAQRIFVTGLSAGGATTSNMLATYPEVFAGGAIIAGLPFGAAASVGDAFSRMAGTGYPDDAELAARVRDASPYDGRWPRISVWQGSADTTVEPSNADRIIAQWRSLHGAGSVSEEQRSGQHIRRTWRNRAGEAVLEENIITGMGHGTPLSTHGPDACGTAGPYMLEVGVSSTREIARFWGLGKRDMQPGIVASFLKPATPDPSAERVVPKVATSAFQRTPASRPLKGIGGVIEDALRAAGLMK